MDADADRARWFDKLGVCSCGKPATGTLRGPSDDLIEVCCDFCARRRIEKSRRNRGLDPSYVGQEWWERAPANVIRKAACPHGYVDINDCPTCGH